MDLRLRRRSDSALARCAYCHESEGELCACCPFCGAGLHGDCWQEIEVCPSLGCGFEIAFSERFRESLVPEAPPRPAPQLKAEEWLARSVPAGLREPEPAGPPQQEQPVLVALPSPAFALWLAFWSAFGAFLAGSLMAGWGAGVISAVFALAISGALALGSMD